MTDASYRQKIKRLLMLAGGMLVALVLVTTLNMGRVATPPAAVQHAHHSAGTEFSFAKLGTVPRVRQGT
jgi:hypothetical protein